jgi:hypothetical protein
VAALALLTPRAAAAQWSGVDAGAGISYQSYSFSAGERIGVEGISLLTLPVSARVALTRELELAVAGAYASGTLRRSGGGESTLSGLVDTEVRLTWATLDDRLRLTGMALVPTGEARLDAGAGDVAGVVAADVLPFGISNWGTGGGVGGSAAFAAPLSDDVAAGLSVGYVLAREYEPLADTDFAYRPGNQLQLRAAVDRTFGSSGKASLQLTYLRHGEDRLSGQNLYRPGDRAQAVASYAFAAGALASGVVYAGYLRRQEGEYTSLARVTPAEDLLHAGVGFRLPLSARLLLAPAAELRVVASGAGGEEGHVMALGTDAEVPLGGSLLVPGARVRFGSVTVVGGADSGFTGFEVGLKVRRRAVLR